MKTIFVETENWTRLSQAAAMLRGHSEEEPRLGVVCGRTGLGKTMAVRRYAAKYAYIYLAAIDAWSPSVMLRAVAREVGAFEHRERARCFAACVRKLEEDPQHIIIDEADYLAANRHLLNTVRDLHDHTGCSIILVGEEALPVKLERVANFWGRVAYVLSFAPLGSDEVSLIARELCGLDLTVEQAERIRSEARGDFRRMKKILRRLEMIVRANSSSGVSEKTIELAMRSIRKYAA